MPSPGRTAIFFVEAVVENERQSKRLRLEEGIIDILELENCIVLC